MIDPLTRWFEQISDAQVVAWIEENAAALRQIVDEFGIEPDVQVDLKVFASVAEFHAQWPERQWPQTFTGHCRPPARIGIVSPEAIDLPFKPESTRVAHSKTLVHEFSHFMTYCFLRRGQHTQEQPLWLMEGIARLQAQQRFTWPGMVENLAPLADVDSLHQNGYGPHIVATVVAERGFDGVKRLLAHGGDITALGETREYWDAAWHETARRFATTN